MRCKRECCPPTSHISPLTFPARDARRRYGTLPALRYSGRTHHRPQLHDRLIDRPCPGAGRGMEPRGGLPDSPVSRGILRRPRVECPPEDARDVGIDSGNGPLERKARDRARGVTADTGQETKRLHIVRNLAAVLTHHIPRESVKIRGPAVIPQPIPRLPHPRRPCPGQRLDRRKRSQETPVVGLDSCHLGLLQHDLGDQDSIRVARAPPREVPPMAAEPREELPPKARGACDRGGLQGHESPR